MDTGLIDLGHVLVRLVTEEIEILVVLDEIRPTLTEIMVFYSLQTQLYLFLVWLLHSLMEFLLHHLLGSLLKEINPGSRTINLEIF